MFKITSLPRRTQIVLAVVVIFIAVGLVVVFTRQQADTAVNSALTRTFDKSPTGFTLNYPQEWEYLIPMSGLVVLGSPKTLYENQTGPTFTIQRIEPLSVYGTLDEALNRYLRRGPLSSDRQWAKLGEITTSTFLGREARRVELQGKENDVSPELRAQVIATVAQNTFVYLIVLTAPAAEWEQQQPTLQAMLNTTQILE